MSQPPSPTYGPSWPLGRACMRCAQLLVADATGLQHLTHPVEQPYVPWEPEQHGARDEYAALGCESDAACNRALRTSSPIDYEMYAEAERLMGAKVAALGAPFAQRVETLRRARAERAQRYARDRRRVELARRADDALLGRGVGAPQRNETAKRMKLFSEAHALRRDVDDVNAQMWAVSMRRRGVVTLGEAHSARRKRECRGMLGGASGEGEEICAAVLADTMFHLPWCNPRPLPIASTRRAPAAG